MNDHNSPFSEKHPRLNFLFGLVIILVFLLALFFIIRFIITKIALLIVTVSKMDAVLVVAIITGGVSLLGVIISSIVAKIIDYRKSRQAYLAQKREKAYENFVDMVYKMADATNSDLQYTNEMRNEDIKVFSKALTLWGSKKVVING